MIIKVYPASNFEFRRPKLLTESEFNEYRSRYPISPIQENAFSMTFSKYWWVFIFSIVPLPPITIMAFLVSNTYQEVYNYYEAINDKNKFYRNYYDSIYRSKNYQEYCTINKSLKY